MEKQAYNQILYIGHLIHKVTRHLFLTIAGNSEATFNFHIFSSRFK